MIYFSIFKYLIISLNFNIYIQSQRVRLHKRSKILPFSATTSITRKLITWTIKNFTENLHPLIASQIPWFSARNFGVYSTNVSLKMLIIKHVHWNSKHSCWISNLFVSANVLGLTRHILRKKLFWNLHFLIAKTPRNY